MPEETPPIRVQIVRDEESLFRKISAQVPLVTSLFAIGLSIFSVHESIKHDSLNFAPLVTYHLSSARYGSGIPGIFLTNNGLGPVIVKDFRVYFDGAQLPVGSAPQFRDQVLKRAPGIFHDIDQTTWTYFSSDVALGVNKETYILQADPNSIDRPGFNKLIQHRLTVAFEACSVFDDTCRRICTNGRSDYCKQAP